MKKLLMFVVSVVVVCVVFVASVFADSGTSATGFLGIIAWLKANWESVLTIIGGVISTASIIVKLTPTQKDDTALATFIKFLSIFSIFNPDGSSIGKKSE